MDAKRRRSSHGNNNNEKIIKTKSDKETFCYWEDLKHSGPYFLSLKYEPLPEYVFFKYNNKKFRLSPKSEEVASYYAKVYKKYTNDDVFKNNFLNDWREVMTNEEKELITDLNKCYFDSIAAYFNRPKNKKTIPLEVKTTYGYCRIDGREEKVQRFIVTGPGLFIGNGTTPKRGKLRTRVMPEDVTVNCSESEIPIPPIGHNWKEVKHSKTGVWLASWKNNVTEELNYMRLCNSSELKQKFDLQKYDTARKLHEHIDTIRHGYMEDWRSEYEQTRQHGVALYLIDLCVFRAGNEKPDDEADTVGCCSLRVEHVRLIEDNHEVEFNFRGKCSIPYKRKVTVEEEAFKNLKDFKENKEAKDDVFDKITPKTLNDYLKTFMHGLTIKVFRTYKASMLFEKYLNETPTGCSDKKMYFLKKANYEVAKICNHKRTKRGSKKQDFAKDTSLSHYIDPRICLV